MTVNPFLFFFFPSEGKKKNLELVRCFFFFLPICVEKGEKKKLEDDSDRVAINREDTKKKKRTNYWGKAAGVGFVYTFFFCFFFSFSFSGFVTGLQTFAYAQTDTAHI